MTKRESQLSFNLSDLSDEEVDRRITRLTVEIENEVNFLTDHQWLMLRRLAKKISTNFISFSLILVKSLQYELHETAAVLF